MSKVPVVVGHERVRAYEYYYMNRTAPADGEGPRQSFVGNGFQVKLELNPEGVYAVVAPNRVSLGSLVGGHDTFTIDGEEISISPGWAWRSIREFDRPIYGVAP